MATSLSNILLNTSKVLNSVLSYKAQQRRNLPNATHYHPPPHGFGKRGWVG